MQARVTGTDILCGHEACRWIWTEIPFGRDGRGGILRAGRAMKLGWGRGRVEGGLKFIAPFPLCTAFPIQSYAVVTSFALPFTILTSWSFFSTLDLAVLAGPVVTQQWSGCVDV